MTDKQDTREDYVRIEPPEGWEPDPEFPEGHGWSGRARCLQWLYGSGRQCKQFTEVGRAEKQHPLKPEYNSKCKFHGGRAASGITHYNYQGKGTSRISRPGFAKVYEGAMADTELLNLQRDVAFHETRLFELSLKIAEDDSNTDLWEIYLKVSDSKRRLVEAETRRREKMRYLVLLEDALADYSALGVAVQRILTTEPEIELDVAIKLLEKIRDEFDRIVSAGTPLLPPPD